MKKSFKLIFSILIIIGIVGSSSIILERKRVEDSNNIYQLAIDAKSIEYIKDNEKREEFYQRLKKSNVSTVTFDNISIKEISKYRDLRYMTVNSYLEDKENFDYKVKGFIPKYASKDDIVIMASKEDFSQDEINLIKDFLRNYEVMEDDKDIFFYIDEPIEIFYKGDKVINSLITSKFFIDKSGIKELSKQGLTPILSISNATDKDIQSMLFNQIIELHDEFNIDKIQMSGSQVIGFPKNTSKFLDEFKKNSISIVTTEFQTNIGLNAYVKNGQQNLIRGHEIPVNKLNLSKDEFAARIARAVKERNMRVIIITDFIDYRNSNTINESMDAIVSNLEESQKQLEKGYTCGIAQNYEIMNRQPKVELFVGLGSASMVGLLLLSIFNKNDKSTLLSIAGAIVVFAGAIVVNKLQIGIGIKAYAFGISIVGACAAIIVPYKSKSDSIIFKFILTSLLATITGLLVASIMYGTDYILKLRTFSGIKMLYVLPPVLITIWVILESGILKGISLSKENLSGAKFDKQKAINIIKNIKWYHVAIVVLVAVGGVVYIKRSGNSGNASELELQLRRTLEEVLYVRPRTKEFMLGYPAIVVAYYMYKEKIKHAQYMLIPGAIATMSTVNTFTHLHTPIVYSLLRTVYGIVLGLIVGLIYILIFKKIRKFMVKEK